jgi:hypothetical protein
MSVPPMGTDVVDMLVAKLHASVDSSSLDVLPEGASFPRFLDLQRDVSSATVKNKALARPASASPDARRLACPATKGVRDADVSSSAGPCPRTIATGAALVRVDRPSSPLGRVPREAHARRGRGGWSCLPTRPSSPPQRPHGLGRLGHLVWIASGTMPSQAAAPARVSPSSSVQDRFRPHWPI